MRLCRYLDSNAPRIGRLEGDTIVPTRLDDMYAVMRGADLTPDGAPVSLGDVTLLAPLRPGKLLGIAKNYADHAAEAGLQVPKEPIIFNKAPTCVCGPNDDTITPRESTKLDYEIELGIVVGKRARYLTKENTRAAIAGYFLANDVSERSFQIERSGGQWDKGKGCETFGPIGPWFVTRDEIKDPQNLDMWLDVNGERRQSGNTKTMIFNCEHLVWYCSQFFVMEPGDIIITGTPPGVALGMKPTPKFLQVGDVVTLGIEGLGQQKQKVVAARK